MYQNSPLALIVMNLYWYAVDAQNLKQLCH